jgi:hypothetical protein
LLAEYIRVLFSNKLLAENLCVAGIAKAVSRHDRNTNKNLVMQIYKTLDSSSLGFDTP